VQNESLLGSIIGEKEPSVPAGLERGQATGGRRRPASHLHRCRPRM